MDSAFKTAPYGAYTTDQLRRMEKEATDATAIVMQGEIARRERVAAGDVDSMTPGERLRFAKTGKAR
ncbi:hypothetical protein RFN29_15055 [Mesorhizobium sp. VK22B]|uniref:Antitoxin VbhA domain-containing protein n=1 Tax=Mesorhizobium captivum TaxID=3072319 RepID=A0ABU4Z106_9HYPH|nr:hypothetical protein [Mesorhizobium sp. VK22B]MDX8492895.1 hypothetical protein [Mesorhizobium sp. VK22B]